MSLPRANHGTNSSGVHQMSVDSRWTYTTRVFADADRRGWNEHTLRLLGHLLQEPLFPKSSPSIFLVPVISLIRASFNLTFHFSAISLP